MSRGRELLRRVRDAVTPAGDAPTGYSLYSPANDRRFEHWVWTPPGRGPFPVLLLLHGISDATGFLWWQKGQAKETAAALVERGQVPPFILVIGTDGGFARGSAYCDWADGSARAETHIVNELLPWIDNEFPTSGVRHVAGNSMGGYGAVTLALRHPGTFASASAMSGYFRPRTRFGADAHDRMAAMYGDEQGVRAHDPFVLVAEAQAAAGLRLLLDCGVDDQLLPDSREFHEHLIGLGVPHAYAEHAGGHTWDYWRSHLGDHFRFHLATH